MTASIYTYLEYIGAALMADTDIIAYCQANFNKHLSVCIGQDESQLPPDEDCPMVVITAGARGFSNNNNIKNRSAKIGVFIRNETRTTPNANRVLTYAGAMQIDVLTDLIAETINNLAAHSSGYYVSDLSDGPDDVINFPIFRAYFGLAIQFDSDF